MLKMDKSVLATITSGGSGYQVGDVVGITTIGLSTGGSGTVGVMVNLLLLVLEWQMNYFR